MPTETAPYPALMRGTHGPEFGSGVASQLRMDETSSDEGLNSARCLWCGGPFEPRHSGGRPQRFCEPTHRRAFDTAARRFVGALIGAGQVSVADLHAPPTTRALLPGAISGLDATGLVVGFNQFEMIMIM